MIDLDYLVAICGVCMSNDDVRRDEIVLPGFCCLNVVDGCWIKVGCCVVGFVRARSHSKMAKIIVSVGQEGKIEDQIRHESIDDPIVSKSYHPNFSLNTQFNRPHMAERKKYDMQQALAMQGKVRRPKREKSGGHNTTTTTAVDKALQKLDRAEELSTRGKLEESSALYWDAIDTLIKIMNEMKKSNADDASTSLEVLKERTKAALTDAESIQETIKAKNARKKKQNVTVQEEQVQGKKIEQRGALGFLRRKSKSEKMVVKKNEKDPIHHVPIPSLQMSKSASGRLNSKASTKSLKSKPKAATVKKSNLNYRTNDPFIETIKRDMYVDSQSLSTSWNDISGLAEPKQALQEAAILPLLRPDLYTGLRAAPRGILLYGPPGTGKTMLVKAVSHESQCILFSCSASSMTSKWVGEGEKLVRTLFRIAADVAPSIIFLDEIDALLGRRKSDNSEQESSRRFKTEFMVQMDGVAAGSGDSQNKTLLIGCTNCPWDIDDAVMRRFQRRIYVPLPDRDARKTLWKKLLVSAGMKDGSVVVAPKDVEKLIRVSEGFSCSDISSIANEAAFGPLREFGIEAIKNVKADEIRPIKMKDFEHAVANTKKSVSSELLQRYNEWEANQAAVR